jgi:RNA polymerase sigma factor (sigma-70 family)
VVQPRSERASPSSVRRVPPQRGGRDAEEFDDFFRREYRKLVASVMFVGARREEAEDAVTEAMVLAARRFPDLEHPAVWVRVAAQRLYIKKAQRERELARREQLMSPPAAPARPGDHDLLDFVREILATMPPAQATVLALTIDGYTAGEIASMLGCPQTTVRSNLRNARATMAAALKKGGWNNG